MPSRGPRATPTDRSTIAGRAAPARRRLRLAAALVAAAAIAVAATGCVGKTGRNDDYVQPGSTAKGPSGQVVPVEG